MSIKVDSLFGGYWLVDNEMQANEIINGEKRDYEKYCSFHDKLMSMGVKSYRCNDGHVDRENHIITFFDFEKWEGWYWCDTTLKEGDKIFIGNAADGGQFAVVDKMVWQSIGHWSEWHYILLDEFYPEKKTSKKKISIFQRIKIALGGLMNPNIL